MFAFGLPVAVVVVSLLPYGLHRVGAMPIGVGLAWLGFALWTERREGRRAFGVTDKPTAPPDTRS